MVRNFVLMMTMCCFILLSTTAFAQNGFGVNTESGQGAWGGAAGVGGTGLCQYGDGTGLGLGLGLMFGFGDGTEPMPQDGTGFGAPVNR